jgi:hypothetical protein
MKIEELRVGNIIIPITESGHELSPRTIKAVEMFYISENMDKVKPVPITEDWLLMFGFNTSGDYFYSTYRTT